MTEQPDREIINEWGAELQRKTMKKGPERDLRGTNERVTAAVTDWVDAGVNVELRRTRTRNTEVWAQIRYQPTPQNRVSHVTKKQQNQRKDPKGLKNPNTKTMQRDTGRWQLFNVGLFLSDLRTLNSTFPPQVVCSYICIKTHCHNLQDISWISHKHELNDEAKTFWWSDPAVKNAFSVCNTRSKLLEQDEMMWRSHTPFGRH